MLVILRSDLVLIPERLSVNQAPMIPKRPSVNQAPRPLVQNHKKKKPEWHECMDFDKSSSRTNAVLLIPESYGGSSLGKYVVVLNSSGRVKSNVPTGTA